METTLYNEIDTEEYRELMYRKKATTRELKYAEMLSGERDPIDQNYFDMKLGKEVVVSCRNGKIVNGFIRTPKDSTDIDGYIVELDTGEILSAAEFSGRIHNPPQSIGYPADKAMVFKIDKPNHKHIFSSMKELEKDEIDALKQYAKREGKSALEYLAHIERLIEKYPEEFL